MAHVINVEVTPRRDESFEKMLKRFMKKVKKEGILEEFRAHDSFVKPSLLRRLAEKRRLQVARKIQQQNLEEENTYKSKFRKTIKGSKR